MFTMYCKWCRKRMYFYKESQICDFCGKVCYGKWCQYQAEKHNAGPELPPLGKDNINEEGYTALVSAIVKQAAEDVTKLSPGTAYRVSAEQFFKSDYFAALTGLDGETVLKNLLRQNAKKEPGRKKMAHRAVKVRCVETGVVYRSIKDAAADIGLAPKSLQNHLRGHNHTAAGKHFEYVEEGN